MNHLTGCGKIKAMDPEQEDRIMIELGTLAEKLDSILRLLEPKPLGRPRKPIGQPIPGVQRAVEFLQALEEDFGSEISSTDLWNEATARGVNKVYLFEAKRELGITAFKKGRQWFWRLRPEEAVPRKWVTHPTRGISVPFDSLTDEEKAQVEGGASADASGAGRSESTDTPQIEEGKDESLLQTVAGEARPPVQGTAPSPTLLSKGDGGPDAGGQPDRGVPRITTGGGTVGASNGISRADRESSPYQISGRSGSGDPSIPSTIEPETAGASVDSTRDVAVTALPTTPVIPRGDDWVPGTLLDE